MKRTISILAVALSLCSGVPAFAGGGSASFPEQGRPLLAQVPSLVEAISKLSIEERGVMGPPDAPFDGMHLYTYMEFRGRSNSPAPDFTLRIHFTSMRDMTLQRIEIISREERSESTMTATPNALKLSEHVHTMNPGQLPPPEVMRMRLAAEAEPTPLWTGDLSDDCTALWAGFTLRAEKMDADIWWWATYVDASNRQIASSNDTEVSPRTAEEARAAAFRAARSFLYPR